MKNFNNIMFLFLVSLSLSIVSCRDNSKEATPANSPVETTENPKKTTAKVNPQHGEPGHRCDLPVGASLDQANKLPKPEVSNQSPVRIKSATPRINPPHGQPGHDCSVAVGAKLVDN